MVIRETLKVFWCQRYIFQRCGALGGCWSPGRHNLVLNQGDKGLILLGVLVSPALEGSAGYGEALRLCLRKRRLEQWSWKCDDAGGAGWGVCWQAAGCSACPSALHILAQSLGFWHYGDKGWIETFVYLSSQARLTPSAPCLSRGIGVFKSAHSKLSP